MSQLKMKLILKLNDNLKNSSEIVEKEPISALISDFEEIKNILNKKECNLKLLYFNKKNIHAILYKSDRVININELKISELSDYFYLISLIEDDNDIVNYEYDFNFIKNIYDKQLVNEKNNKLKIILSIIILKLISNYKGTNYYDEAEDYTKIAEISKKIRTIINDCDMEDFDLDLEGIDEGNINKKVKIYKIYSDIINKIILSDKIDNNEYVNNILIKELNLLDFQKIYITKNILEELTKTLNENNDKIKKYIIKDLKNFSKNSIINFYFILFKYILKNTIYLYKIPLLLESRKNFLNIIKTNLKEICNIYNINNNNKFKYIIEFFTDSKYYEKYIISYINKKEQNEQIKSVKKIDLSVSSKISKGVISTKTKTKNLNISIDIEDLQILKYENEITLPKKEYNYLTFIKELNNGYYIIGAPNDILYIYDKNYNYKKTINFKVSKEDLDKFSTQLNTKKIIENENKKGNNQGNNNEIKIIFYIRNIIETNNSKEKNKLEINICSKLVFSKYSFDCSNNNNKLNYSKTIFIPVNGCFEINIDKNNNYILYGEKGLFHLDKNPFNCRISTIDNMGKYQKDKNERNYRGGIQLNNNLIALTSNKVYPNGEDIIIFYDTKNEKIINKCPGYSFVNNINGLVFIQLEQNKNILLCACKKYKNGQQNGILLINADIKENEKINQKFFDTEEFEVNCFCLIQQIKSGKKYKNNFFLVGGLDAEKNVGIIKLYKINETDMDIEFLEDFIDNGHNGHFEGTINCILQSQQDGKILVCCWDNKIYIYSKPNIDLYLDE